MLESPRRRQAVLDDLKRHAALPDTMGWAAIGFTVAEARVLVGHIEVLHARIRQAGEKIDALKQGRPTVSEPGS